MNRRRRWLLLVLLVALSVAAAVAFRMPILSALGTWLDVGERPSPCQYVMILNGGERTRPFVAALMVKAGLAEKVLITTSILSPEQQAGLELPTDEIIRQILLRRGVPEDRIVVFDRTIVNTFHEAESLAVFLADRPNARVAVVTDDFHTRRSRWIFNKVLGKKAERVQFVTAPSDEFRLDRWWQSPLGFEVVSGEYARLVFYSLRYRDLRPWAGLLLLTVAGALLFARRRAKKKRLNAELPPEALSSD